LTVDQHEVPTEHGPARVHLHRHPDPVGLIALGHGAAGGVSSPDLLAATQAAAGERFSVALVEQPYRVAGRRSPPPARQLDAAWLVVNRWLGGELRESARMIVGGRSMGARVACRTAAACDAIAVLCLAFPLRPPRRSAPAPSRLPELDAVTVPTLVVQGERDRFGMPPPGSTRAVAQVPGDHSLKTGAAAVGAAVRQWLRSLAI
jgi:uncharacterized protein